MRVYSYREIGDLSGWNGPHVVKLPPPPIPGLPPGYERPESPQRRPGVPTWEDPWWREPMPPMAFGPALVKAGTGTGAVATSIGPAFGQATTAGNFLLCLVASGGNTALTLSLNQGWTQGPHNTATGAHAEIWFKPNCAAGETAPTVTASASTRIDAVLLEFSGIATTTPLDQSGSLNSTTSPQTVSCSAVDGGAGRLIAVAGAWASSAASTATFTDTLTGYTVAYDSGATSRLMNIRAGYSLTATTGSVADSDQAAATKANLNAVALAIASFAPAGGLGTPRRHRGSTVII